MDMSFRLMAVLGGKRCAWHSTFITSVDVWRDSERLPSLQQRRYGPKIRPNVDRFNVAALTNRRKKHPRPANAGRRSRALPRSRWRPKHQSRVSADFASANLQILR